MDVETCSQAERRNDEGVIMKAIVAGVVVGAFLLVPCWTDDATKDLTPNSPLPRGEGNCSPVSLWEKGVGGVRFETLRNQFNKAVVVHTN